MGTMRLRKSDYAQSPIKVGDCIHVTAGENRPRYSFANGTRKPTGERDYWIISYTCQPGKDVV